MARFTGYAPCPKCREKGSDRRGDNLGQWDDGSGHCFSCGYHMAAKFYKQFEKKDTIDVQEKASLPSDFTREVPAAGWKWLLQYGLPYSYWKPYTGYSPKADRLILTFGNPIRFSQGRYLGDSVGERKWKFYGDGHGYVETLGNEIPRPVVLVEDLISAHKVAQDSPCICLFGTNIHALVVKELQALNRPVKLWLDADQYQNLPKQVAKLQTFLRWPVSYVYTDKDPKAYSSKEISEYLK